MTLLPCENGISIRKVENFRDARMIIESLACSEGVFRGQADQSWEVLSSFDRLFKGEQDLTDIYDEIRNEHLNNFKETFLRGSVEKTIFREFKENEWWALGQHYGLRTPLLDWSSSIEIALFFALSNEETLDDYHPVFFFNRNLMEHRQKSLGNSTRIEFIDASQTRNINKRLKAQKGVFTITKNLFSIQDVTAELKCRYLDEEDRFYKLIENKLGGKVSRERKFPSVLKVLFRSDLKNECLRHLSEKSICESDLFPNNDREHFPNIDDVVGECNDKLKEVLNNHSNDLTPRIRIP